MIPTEPKCWIVIFQPRRVFDASRKHWGAIWKCVFLFSSSHPISPVAISCLPESTSPHTSSGLVNGRTVTSQVLGQTSCLTFAARPRQVRCGRKVSGLRTLLLRLAEVHVPPAGNVLLHQLHEPSEESNPLPFTRTKALLSMFDAPLTHTSSASLIGIECTLK